jgi:hypothetical protein
LFARRSLKRKLLLRRRRRRRKMLIHKEDQWVALYELLVENVIKSSPTLAFASRVVLNQKILILLENRRKKIVKKRVTRRGTRKARVGNRVHRDTRGV